MVGSVKIFYTFADKIGGKNIAYQIKSADMKRKFENTLLEWKNNNNALPLMLIGARQTGKTYIVEKFCNENFENTVQLNFLEEENSVAQIGRAHV